MMGDQTVERLFRKVIKLVPGLKHDILLAGLEEENYRKAYYSKNREKHLRASRRQSNDKKKRLVWKGMRRG